MFLRKPAAAYIKSLDIWDAYSNTLSPNAPCEGTEMNGTFLCFEPFKLHITINSVDNHAVITQIRQLLITAILDNKIRGFKGKRQLNHPLNNTP